MLAGGYARILALTPIAIALFGLDVAAVVVAGLQLRDDRAAARASAWLVWGTLLAGIAWALYAIAMFIVFVIARVFCVNQLCRGPLG